MSARHEIAPCPVTVSVNVDVESLDARNAGEAGLFGRYSYGRHGACEGLWRLLNVFREQDACNFLHVGG